MPNKIETQLEKLNNNPNKLSFCPVIHFNRFNTDISSLKPTNRELTLYQDNNDPFEFLLNLYDIKNGKAAIIPIHSWLTPVSLLNHSIEWNKDLTVNDDGEFFCRVVLSSAGVIASNNTFCYYRKYVNENRVSLSGRKDLKSLESHYNSLMLIREHLVKTQNDNRINSLVADNLMALLMQAYPEYKNLSEEIEKCIRKLGNTAYSPVLGGKIIESVKRIFGWKIARVFQHFYKSVAIK
jgi:hypothetical protein